MRKFAVIALCFLIFVSPESVWANPDTGENPGKAVVIPADTVIELDLSTPVHSKRSRVGDMLILKVRDGVRVNGTLVIQKGATALAYVTDIKRAGPWGKGGGIKIKAACTWSVNDVKVPIAFDFSQKGDGHKMLFPVVLFGLYAGYITGEQVAIPSGTKFTAKVAEDTSLLLSSRDLNELVLKKAGNQ